MSLPASMQTKIHYSKHNEEQVRVWADTWFGDQFEVVDATAFRVFKDMGERLGLKFIDHTFDDE